MKKKSIKREDIIITTEDGNLNIRIKAVAKGLIEFIDANKDSDCFLSTSKTDFIRNSYRINPEYFLSLEAAKTHFEKKFKDVCGEYANGNASREKVLESEKVLRLCEEEFEECIKVLEEYEIAYRESTVSLLKEYGLKVYDK